MSKRAVRRAHIVRLKKHRRFWWGRELTATELGRVIVTPTPCSCWMCGNQSRVEGDKAKYKALVQKRLFSFADSGLLLVQRKMDDFC